MVMKGIIGNDFQHLKVFSYQTGSGPGSGSWTIFCLVSEISVTKLAAADGFPALGGGYLLA